MEAQVKLCYQCRSALKNNLGDRFPVYIRLVLDWIRKRKTKSQLDLEVLNLFKDNDRKIHSIFLASLSKLCWRLTSLRIEQSLPVNVANNPESDNLSSQHPTPVPAEDEYLLNKKIYTDLNIPGTELIRARLYLAAWDLGLTHVEPKVGRLLYFAMKNYLKDIIHAAISDKGTNDITNGSSARTKLEALPIWLALMRTNYDVPSNLYAPFQCHSSNTKTI